MEQDLLTKKELNLLNDYLSTANYLSAAQLYLKDNPLLKRTLEFDDVKSKLVGHWGTCPGQNFIYTHLNRIIKKYDLNMIYVSGPGHGGNCIISQNYIDGTYTEYYPEITQNEEGLKKLFKSFSFPGGMPSHVAPEVPGSINEGGELGYSLAHSYGAVLDNPKLMVACVIGDGEAETGPLAGSWLIHKILNPMKDGVVLPILHLNGYKIANPTLLARISEEDLISYFKGLGYKPYIVHENDIDTMHEDMAKVLEDALEDIRKIKLGFEEARWPMIILRSLKGWTGPKEIDGKKIEGNFRAHQVPIEVTKEDPESLKRLEDWLKSYHPEKLFNEDGSIKNHIKEFACKGKQRMGDNPYANGGLLLKELNVPDYTSYAIDVTYPGNVIKQDMKVLGEFVRDIIKLNDRERNFRIFGPDEALSNRLNAVFEVTNRQWNLDTVKSDEFLADNGAVVDSILSEHVCEGLLEGYILTGRHGFFHCYEAFIRVVDSMVSQHAKWLKVCQNIPWRADVSSLNIILSSHVWQQDHNGYSHQDPGFLNHLVTKKASISRIYLPADANCLLSCFDHIIKTKNYVNVIVASKHPKEQWLSIDEAKTHCAKGIGVWDFASNCKEKDPDIIMACCGDTPTLETLAATSILHEYIPDLKIRFVNVVDLMKLQSNLTHPHGLSDVNYNELFTKNKPIIFAFHGYANLIHELTYKRENTNLHVRGYNEEGTITTPFDMRVQNKIDRFNLVLLALNHLPGVFVKEEITKYCKDALEKHSWYIKEHGKDIPEVTDWKWQNINVD
ncbi:MAG: phosphoketolase family protein [Bacilli bacterium]|nr:phosphoketolase family protein [Bacilli bacterium]